MWSSIEQVIQPDSLSEASTMLQKQGAVLFAGGSYLVSEKDSDIHTLIDINHLLHDSIKAVADNLHIDAGCTLQEIVNSSDRGLSSAALASCPSKNIRNQRTIGGEIARMRTDSDLVVFLFTAGAQLILNNLAIPVKLADWDGTDIIVEVIIPKHDVKIERVALLDSAPAFVIVGLNNLDDAITMSVGGKVSRITTHHNLTQPYEAKVQSFMEKVSDSFSDDHLGSSEYKLKLVNNLLQEMGGGK